MIVTSEPSCAPPTSIIILESNNVTYSYVIKLLKFRYLYNTKNLYSTIFLTIYLS
jgi:hypothetical protein